eukprot:scaffold34314_cov45-Prasinocladus_malaysianus.AAC.1
MEAEEDLQDALVPRVDGILCEEVSCCEQAVETQLPNAFRPSVPRGILLASPCSRLLAVVCPSRESLTIVAENEGFRHSGRSFSPSAQPENTTGKPAMLLRPAWSPDSSTVCVPDTTGHVWM